MSDLPSGWTTVVFSEILKILGGTQPPKKTFIYEPRKGYIQLLQIRDFGKKPLATYIPHKGHLRICIKDDIMIARYGASLGRIMTGMEGAFNVAMAKVLIPDQINRQFIYHLLKSHHFQTPILANERSATDGFNKGDLEKIYLPLAPLNEQKRIVEKLDKLLAKVDTAKTRLDKIPQTLKRFRQSVLSAAVSGKLTKEWREKNKILDDWEIVVLKDVADLRLGKMLDKSKNIGEKTKYLRNINVRWFYVDVQDLAELRITKNEKEVLDIRNGDLLVCEGGEPGRCAVWLSGKNDLTFQKAIHRVRLNKNIISKWLMYNLKNDADSQRLEEYFTGTTIKHLTGQSLKTYTFTNPSLEEQKEIVRRVEELFKYADQIEARYNKAKQYVDKLTQSILAKAFRGELVLQDPNDEPAEKLLERILFLNQQKTIISNRSQKVKRR